MEQTYFPTLFSVTALLLIHYCCMQASLAINNAAINITTDQSALLALKARIDSYDPNNVLANNWSTNAPVCNWIGISCGSRHHRVTALNLAHMRLEGTIPPHLGNLSFLVRLIMTNNSFHGSLPPELSRLRRLKVFVVRSNKLDGEIPSWIGLLTRLQSLFLDDNSFTGSMPSMISNLSSLQVLDLSSNKLSGRLKMDKFDNLPNLLAISATYNQFHGELPSTLYNCKQLQILSLSVNNFSGRLPPQIGNLTMLNTLYLALNNFEGAIPSEIGYLQNLELLSLFHNSFEGPIPLEIFNISTIQIISMPINKLSGHLPSNIGLFLPNLQQLFLGENQLSGPIPSSITNASQLTKFHLMKNSFSGFIPKSLGNLRLLQELNLPFNNLTVESSSGLSNLFLDLSNCRYLEWLDLSENPLNVILPSSIGNLSTSLQRFILGNCKIKGNIPTDIGEFNNLNTLGLYNNELTGSLPATLGKLYKLQGLYLDHNRLEGPVPSSICHLKSLFALHLDHNKLSGHIPTCINNLTFLRELYFSFNQLTSTIPLSLWSLTYLLEVDLSSNSFSGSLAREIEDMKVLIKLDISRNQLSGGIPSISFKDMVNLSLARNQLEGSIPESFGEMVSLVLLDLSHNNLSGEIPKSLEALQHLKFLNVSFNRLQGEIPTGGPFVNLSAASFLPNYALCGAPQLQVAPCKEVHHHHHRRILMYVLPIVGLTILVTFLVLVRKRWRKRNVIKSQVVEELSPLETWKRISHLELQQATEGFNPDNLIGKGSFGFVYKGTLSDGMDVAIKVLNLEVEGAFKSFDAECLVLRNIRHRNLVKIISACSNMNFKAFVLEYMPNGNLETWLYNRCLTMLQRLNIMTDVAAALEYLHFGLSTPIIHCDLKPSNVLLDAEMVAHVADFGIAKLLDDGDSLTRTMTLASMGYMAPAAKIKREKKQERKKLSRFAEPTGNWKAKVRNFPEDMGGHGAIEVAKTVLEVADVAWTAMEHHHHHHHEHDGTAHTKTETNSYDELESLRSENRRLRTLLEQNLKLLQDLSESPFSLNDCPPDLYARLVATVDSEQFLARLKSLQQASIKGTSSEFPFKETSGYDVDSAEVLIKVDSEEPSRWVWVTDEMVPSNVEEWSGVDNENYVVVSEEHVVDGVANFMARCIMSNPKSQNLTPEELQKTVAKALGGVSKLEKILGIWHAGKLFYALSTWGLALAGLYRTRAVLKLAAAGVHTTSKVVLRAL